MKRTTKKKRTNERGKADKALADFLLDPEVGRRIWVDKELDDDLEDLVNACRAARGIAADAGERGGQG